MNRRSQNTDGSGVLQCSNRTVTPEDVEQIRRLIVRYPDWGRQQLSVHLSQLWDWHRPDGTLRHRACRHLLVRLAEQGKIPLPPSKLIVTHNPHGWRLGVWTHWAAVQNDA